MSGRRSSSTRTSPAPRKMKIHSGDQVKLISGKDRGKSGRVLRVDPSKQRVFVEGLNMIKRHTKPQQVTGTGSQAAGGVIEREGPIHVSNVMLLDPKDNKPTRVSIERENGKAFRVARRSGTRID
jgi:large subunit ribosomal protein L24